MPEVTTECTCGQLPPLEPWQRPTCWDCGLPGDRELVHPADAPHLLVCADREACRQTRAMLARVEFGDDGDPVARACDDCGAEPGEECRPDCIGQAAHLDELGIDVTADEAPAKRVRGPMPAVTYDGITYKLRSRRTEVPDLDAMSRTAALIWINQNTTRRGAGINTRPNPLRGLGAVLSVEVR